ncbi:MAG TPA: Cof-type HAD-IIB family hydrolase [Symbiobacteriaceae bacterium]
MKKTYKLIALDIDGTVLGRHYRVAPETKRVLAQAMARGVRVTLATGRGFPGALPVAREIGANAPLVTHDGAYVADPATGKVLFERRIELPVVRTAVELLQPLGLFIHLLYPDCVVTNQRFRNIRWSLLLPHNWPGLLSILQENRVYRPVYAADLSRYLQQHPVPVPKIYVSGRAEAIQEGRRRLEAALGEALRCTPAGAEALEVVCRGISKATGLRILAAYLGIGMDEILACGDSHNDLEMLSEVGMGVAMGNAPKDVKRIARFVTLSNLENGVAHAVRRFVLN